MNDSVSSSNSTIHDASFRDPSGFVFRCDGQLLRQINQRYREDFDLLISSGLYEQLVKKKQLIAHQEVDLSLAVSSDAYKVIRPTAIPFISYPYEWCFSQLKDAAKLTLAIQKAALGKRMVLKDASAYNIQFVDGRPVFIDTLSFEKYDASQPWVAYRQFCQHFLAPLALMAHVDVGFVRLLASCIDGIPLEMAASALPWKTKFSLTLGVHLHAHARSQARHARSPEVAQQSKGKFSERQMNLLISGLEVAIDKLHWKGGGTEWADYYDKTHNYGEHGLESKAKLVDELLGDVNPKTVWDLGANLGKFSQLAAARGAHTVAWDIDPSCVEWNYQRIRKEKQANLLPLFQDLTNPSGGIGWANTERDSLASRGPVDVVMALGLIHHLVISNNVPFARVARFLSTLGRHLIIEFVPKEDSQVKLLLETREDIFVNYNIDHFREAFLHCFDLVREVAIDGTCRTSFLYRSKEFE